MLLDAGQFSFEKYSVQQSLRYVLGIFSYVVKNKSHFFKFRMT